MEKDWEVAVKKFLERYKNEELFIGALVSGSYITGTQTKNSDLDLHVVMSDRFHFREKGVLLFEGFLISYTVYPEHSFHRILDMNYMKHQRILSRFFAKGKIIYDDEKETIKKLKDIATNHLKKELPAMPSDAIENKKYVMSTVLENLETLSEAGKEKKPYYNFLYYQLLDFLFRNYSKFLQTDVLNTIRSSSKLYQFFNNPDWNKNYFLPEKYPDEVFSDKFQVCLREISHEEIVDLANYVINKMGGFNSTNWHKRISIV